MNLYFLSITCIFLLCQNCQKTSFQTGYWFHFLIFSNLKSHWILDFVFAQFESKANSNFYFGLVNSLRTVSIKFPINQVFPRIDFGHVIGSGSRLKSCVSQKSRILKLPLVNHRSKKEFFTTFWCKQLLNFCYDPRNAIFIPRRKYILMRMITFNVFVLKILLFFLK